MEVSVSLRSYLFSSSMSLFHDIFNTFSFRLLAELSVLFLIENMNMYLFVKTSFRLLAELSVLFLIL